MLVLKRYVRIFVVISYSSDLYLLMAYIILIAYQFRSGYPLNIALSLVSSYFSFISKFLIIFTLALRCPATDWPVFGDSMRMSLDMSFLRSLHAGNVCHVIHHWLLVTCDTSYHPIRASARLTVRHCEPTFHSHSLIVSRVWPFGSACAPLVYLFCQCILADSQLSV